MVVEQTTHRPAPRLAQKKDAGIIISSRVRLARNIRGVAFPGWAGEDECIRLCERLRGVLEHLPCIDTPQFVDMGALSPVDKEMLKERHLISSELAEKGTGSGLITDRTHGLAVMINEEDHLRMQVIRPGMNLTGAWERLLQVDRELDAQIPYAYSKRLGYLTSCPSNIGTGLRASVMMHLSGLKLTGDIDQTIKGLDKIGLAVRGLFGEGTEASGNMFQISNQFTLGRDEEWIVGHMVGIVQELAMHEQNARQRVMENRRTLVLDHIGRALGLLHHARMLNSSEAIDQLSALRLGVELGVVRNLTIERINEIILLAQPGHLQKTMRRGLQPEERDEVRAQVVKEHLKNVKLTE